MMQALQVASKLIACNGGWLEQQRDITWAALWRGLASFDRHHFSTQHSDVMQSSAVGTGEYVFSYSVTMSTNPECHHSVLYACEKVVKSTPFCVTKEGQGPHMFAAAGVYTREHCTKHYTHAHSC